MDPIQYRPVTIAVAYIKLFCKVMMYKFSLADDLNYLNHAYCKNGRCLSAIFEVQEAIRRIKIKSEALRGSEFEIIPIILYTWTERPELQIGKRESRQSSTRRGMIRAPHKAHRLSLRIFDNFVTRIPSDAVNKVVSECEDIVSFENFSYSDDKMTIIGSKIKKTDTRDMVRTKIKVVAGVCDGIHQTDC